MKRAAAAFIDESRCIGCTRCIDACPVDAIVGASLLMHTVVSRLCTGCELCLPACPVDCIEMAPAQEPWSEADARAAKRRALLRKRRLARRLPQRRADRARRREILAAALGRRR